MMWNLLKLDFTKAIILIAAILLTGLLSGVEDDAYSGFLGNMLTAATHFNVFAIGHLLLMVWLFVGAFYSFFKR